MIKVAMILDDPGQGGAYKVANDIGKGLDKSVFEVRYYFLCDQPENPPEGIFLGKPAIEISYSTKSYVRLVYFPKKCEKTFLPLNKALMDYKPDIVHFHSHPTLLSLITGIREFGLKMSVVYTDHLQRVRHNEAIWSRVCMAKVYQRLFSSSRVVFISKYALQTALKLGFAHSQKDFLINNTIDINNFCPVSKKCEEGTKIVYLARIHPVKGHQLLLDAWKEMPKGKVSLHLYGHEEDGGKVSNRIKNESFPNPVHYEGVTVSPEKVLQQAHIGVFPSSREGLPLALLEMMASGLPIVASDIPEIKGVITNGKNGLLFKCGNKKDLAAKLSILLNDKQLRKKLSEEGRKTVLRDYSRPISEKYDSYYKEIVSQ